MTAELIPGPGWAEAPPPIVDEAARALNFRLPVNEEAEMAFLGAILHDNRAYSNAAGQVQAQDFANRVHGEIYEAAAKLIAQGQIADPITLKQYFETNEDLTAIGGFHYLMTLADSFVSVINAKDYARAILDASRRRQAIALAAKMIEEFSVGGKSEAFETTLSAAVLALESLSLTPAYEGVRPVKDHLRDYLNAVAAAASAEPGQIAGVPTGLTQLDRALSGLKRAGLTVIGARPSMGKSLLAPCNRESIRCSRSDR